MGKSKKKNSGGKMWLVYIVVFVGFVGFIIFNDYGLLKYMKLESEVGNLQSEIKNTEQRLNELDGEIDSLKTNLVKIEKIARERYHMLRKNEKAFKVEKN